MATTILILLGGIFLGAIAVGLGFLAWKFLRTITDATAAIKELSGLSGKGGVSSLIQNIEAIAAAGPGIISSLTVLNETVIKLHKVVVAANAEAAAAEKKEKPTGAASEAESTAYPYLPELAAEMERVARLRASGTNVSDAELPQEATVGQV